MKKSFIQSVFVLASFSTLVGCAKDRDMLQETMLQYEKCSQSEASVTSRMAVGIARRTAGLCPVQNTIHSVASGSWLTPGTWDNGVPTPCDHVIISHAVSYPDQTGTPGYTHYGNINITAQGSFDFREDGVLVLEGEDANHRVNFVSDGNVTTAGDLKLIDTDWNANPQSRVRIGKDLITDGKTDIQNNTMTCNGFVVGDDIVMYSSQTNGQYITNSTHFPIIVGAGPGQTAAASEQSGSLSALDSFIFGVAGTSSSLIHYVHGMGYAPPSACAALPVHFTSVNASWKYDLDNKSVNTVVVKWSTDAEIDSKEYSIEMILPCSSAIQVVASGIPAAGMAHSYTQEVPVTKGGDYLFRVVESDHGTSKTYSNWIRVRVGKK